MKQQTAVEWMVERCNQWWGICDGEYIDPDVVAKAKEMEKEQIEMAHAHGYLECDNFYADKNYKPLNRYDYYERNYGEEI